MQHAGIATGPLVELNIVQNVGHLQRRVTLAIRRKFAQLHGAVGYAGWRYPLTAVGLEVLKGEIAPDACHVGGHNFGKLTAIKSLPAIIG